MNTVGKLLIFSAGVVVGGLTATALLKKKFEEAVDSHLTEMTESFQKKEDALEKTIEDEVRKKLVDNLTGAYRAPTAEEAEKDVHPALETFEIIGPDQFGEEYDVEYLTLYNDGIIARDTTGERIDNPDIYIGSDALRHMGEYEPDCVEVRNHDFRIDYDLSRVRQNYKDLYPDSGEENE